MFGSSVLLDSNFPWNREYGHCMGVIEIQEDVQPRQHVSIVFVKLFVLYLLE